MNLKAISLHYTVIPCAHCVWNNGNVPSGRDVTVKEPLHHSDHGEILHVCVFNALSIRVLKLVMLKLGENSSFFFPSQF